MHLADGTSTQFHYDALGRRYEIDDANGTVASYVYDGSNIGLQYDGTNQLVGSFVNGPGLDNVLAETRGASTYDYLKDGLGSTTALVDAAGSVVDAYTYSAFGQQSASGAVPNPFTYTGREFDARTGLYYVRARYYNPAVGRFVSEDPLPSTNPYPYVSNCPTTFSDPQGTAAMAERVE